MSLVVNVKVLWHISEAVLKVHRSITRFGSYLLEDRSSLRPDHTTQTRITLLPRWRLGHQVLPFDYIQTDLLEGCWSQNSDKGNKCQKRYLGFPFLTLFIQGTSVPLVIKMKALFVSLLSVSFFPFLVREWTLLSFFPCAFFPMFLFSVWFFLLPVSPFSFFFIKPIVKRIVFAVAILQLWSNTLRNTWAHKTRHAGFRTFMAKARNAGEVPWPLGSLPCSNLNNCQS